MRRGIAELTEELRALRLTRVESSALRLSAMGLQLVALLVVGVAFLNLADLENFLPGSAAAAMLQLITITMLLFDRQ